MKINFKEIAIINIEGKEERLDVRKTVGNVLFNMADDVAEHDLGVNIYHSEGEIELNDKERAIIKKFLPMFKYLLRNAIETAMKE